MNRFLFTAPLLLLMKVSAQDSIKVAGKVPFTYSGSADVYYQYDNSKPANKERPPFLYNFKKHNQLNVNLALLKGAYQGQKWRANLAVMAGNYAGYNLAPEPKFFRYINEANIGFAFSGKFSVDAGIFPSHIGLESAIAKDNWNLSRSLLAENTPYYETGIKFNYAPNEKWSFSALVLQGWQNIKDYNSCKAFGTQVQYKPNEKWLFNSSTFIGNEKPDSAKQVRFFHNFYFTYSISSKLKTAFLLDAGAEKKRNGSGMNGWAGTALLLQYAVSPKVNMGGRAEWYSDKTGVIVSSYLPRAFRMGGFALNFDYSPVKFLLLRTETRLLSGNGLLFTRNGVPVNNNFDWLSSMAIFF
ncbi:MAG: porin [Bacteroidota bacterium]